MSATTFTPASRTPFSGVLRGELIKATTTRTMGVSLTLTVVVALATVAGLASVERLAMVNNAEGYTPMNTGGGFALGATAIPILLVWAAYVFFGELGNGVLRSTFLAVPGRGRVLTAKAILTAILGVVTAVVTMALGQVVYGLVLDRPQAMTYMLTGEGLSTMLRLTFVVACWCVVALSIAAITRHLAASVGIITSFYLFIEAYLVDFPGAPWLAYLLPFTSGKAVIPEVSSVELPNQLAAAIGQLAIAGILVGAAYWTTTRRDTK